MRAVVIGAGMVGVSAAIHLQRAGHDVTLIDRDGPATGTSHGNAGVLAASSIVPVTVPGLLPKVPRMLLSPDQPLFLRWSYLPRLLPFLARYLPHGRPRHVERIAGALTTLLHDTTEQHLALAHDTPAARFIVPGDYCYGYEDRAAFEKDGAGFATRKANGFAFEVLEGHALETYDPLMARAFGLVVRFPNHGRITDPGGYIRALAAHFEMEGGKFERASVRDIEVENDRAVAVSTSAGRIAADTIVLAAGIWSGPLASKLGIHLPMEAERGYHVEFLGAGPLPREPVMVAAGKFVLTPMEGRLRCAGIVEFGGLSPRKTRAALDLLIRRTKALLPDLTYERIEEWVGFRPSTSDSLPLIGPAPGAQNVLCGFGHQHVGLTAGPKTGRWLAALASNSPPNVDLAPFAPSRFTARSQLREKIKR